MSSATELFNFESTFNESTTIYLSIPTSRNHLFPTLIPFLVAAKNECTQLYHKERLLHLSILQEKPHAAILGLACVGHQLSILPTQPKPPAATS